MQLFVKLLNGSTRCVCVSNDATAAEIRAAAETPLGVALAASCGILSESCFALAEGETVYELAPVDGGKKKKKKKKIFKGPKKGHHRHKNVSMRVLKFYKVEGDGEGTEYKVTHDRVECPHPDCGAGVFMAVHKDRQTCGKCSLTYVFQKK